MSKQRKDTKTAEKYCKYCGKQLERKRFNGRLEDFNAFLNRKFCDRKCMRKSLLKLQSEEKRTSSNAHTTARKVNELFLGKGECEICGSTEKLEIHHIDKNWLNNTPENLRCLCKRCHLKLHAEKRKNERTEFKNKKVNA